MSTVKHAVRCAIAAAIAGTAANGAYALDISTYAGNASNNVNVYLSGSTAVDGTIQNAVTETAAPGGLCQAGTLDVYYIGSPSTYTERLFYCTGSSSAGSASGKPLAMFKESNVGSENGVGPLILAAKGQATGLSFINPGLISDTNCATTATVTATGDFATYVNHSGCPTTAVTSNAIPTGGFADVEAAILRTPTGGTISAADTAKYLTSAPTLDVVWGVALTKNAFYALQVAEGLPSPSDLPTNAPSLSKEQVAGLFAGPLFNWTQLGLNNPGNGGNNNVYLCRRDIGSGTEASFEAYFLGARCSLSSLAMQNEDANVIWASGSNGGVRACLQDFFSGGKITAFYSSTSVTEPGSQYAVGILSTEVTASNLSGANDSFRLVAVDGVLPTLDNVVNGYYPYFSTGISYYVSSGANQPAAAPLSVLNALKGKLGEPAWTADSDSSYAGRPWGNGGDLSPAYLFASTNPPTTPATAATVAANPVNAFSKASSGAVDNCDTPVFDSNDLSTTAVESTLLGTGNVNHQ